MTCHDLSSYQGFLKQSWTQARREGRQLEAAKELSGTINNTPGLRRMFRTSPEEMISASLGEYDPVIAQGVDLTDLGIASNIADFATRRNKAMQLRAANRDLYDAIPRVYNPMDPNTTEATLRRILLKNPNALSSLQALHRNLGALSLGTVGAISPFITMRREKDEDEEEFRRRRRDAVLTRGGIGLLAGGAFGHFGTDHLPAPFSRMDPGLNVT